MSFTVSTVIPKATENGVQLAFGARRIMMLFILTIITAVSLHYFLQLPPVIGMMIGLSVLKLFGYYIKMRQIRMYSGKELKHNLQTFDIIRKIEHAEWDTLLFFYGVVLCVGGLATIGYLEYISTTMFQNCGIKLGLTAPHIQTPANIMIGFLSAIIDNIPIMFAVLAMNPHMSEGQWLLATLTAGIGGSLFSIGSAAGVALMGQTRGVYTFFNHLKWTWIILIGYFAGITTHIWINKAMFNIPFVIT